MRCACIHLFVHSFLNHSYEYTHAFYHTQSYTHAHHPHTSAASDSTLKQLTLPGYQILVLYFKMFHFSYNYIALFRSLPLSPFLFDMPSRVQFKLCCLAFPCLHGSASPYLAEYFTPVSSIEGRSQLRSAAPEYFLSRVPGR